MTYIKRRKFIGSGISILGLLSLAGTRINNNLIEQIEPDQPGITIRLKGKQDSKVNHWDIITIGNLSRNRYWGESDDRAIRNAICTCAVISGEDFNIIVDPSQVDEMAMANELNRRTGLTPDDIDFVFITHQHGDHLAGLGHFPNARWFAGPAVAAGINNSGRFSKEIESTGGSIYGGIDVIPTPGHTADHQSLRFDCDGLSIVIAGDSVATKNFWDERKAYYNVMDEAESKRSMEMINSIADIIVPGHDSLFFNFTANLP